MSDTTDQKENKKVHGAFVGTVVSDKANKTRVVEIRQRRRHPKYKKIYTITKRFHVHDPENAYKVGDKVNFIPTRPYSKTKKFIIIGKV